MGILISSAIINIVLLFSFYLIGFTILKITKTANQKNLAHYFESLLTGLLFVVFIYAIIATGFKTTFLALIPILIWRLRTKPEIPQLSITENPSYKFLPIVAVSSLMAVLVTLLFYNNYIGLNFSEVTVPLIHHDYIFYPNVAAHINETGAENYLIQSDAQVITMYHYTELWLTGFINRFTNDNYSITFMYQALPVIFTILWIGLAALTESILKNRSLLFYVFVASICFFVSPMAIFIKPFSAFLKGDIYAFPVFQYYKLSVVQLFIVAAFINRDNLNKVIFILLTLTICYQTTLPPILTVFGLFLIVQFIRTKKIDKNSLQIFFTFVLSVIILFSLLVIFRNTENHDDNTSLFEIWIGDIFTYLNTFKNVIISSLLIVTITTLVYIALFAFTIKNIDKPLQKIIAGTLLIQFVGLLFWAALLKMMDSVQIWNNLYLPIINTIIFVIVISVFSDKRIWLKVATILIIIFNFFLNNPVEKKNRLATTSERQIIEKVEASENPNFAFIRHPSEFSNVFYFNTMVVTPSIYLSFHVKSYKPACLNFLSEMEHSYWAEQLFSYSPFAKYGSETNLSFEKIQADYITQNNIKFVFVSEKVKTPDFLVNMTDTVIFDPGEKVKFLVLK